MARITDTQLPSLNQVAAGIKAQACAPAAPTAPAPAPAPSPTGALASDARRVKTGTDVLDVADLDLCGIILPGDVAENGSRGGTSGSAGGRRADAEGDGPVDQDYAENGSRSGTSGSAGGRRAEADIQINVLPLEGTDLADNGNTANTSGSAGPSQPRPRPRPGAGAQAQAAQA
jgi:hypothetical protein